MCQRRQSVRKPFVCISLHIIHVLREGKYITSYTVLVVYIIVEAPVLTADTTTATTITISWTSAGSEDVSYEVMWERDTSLMCTGFSHMDSTTITDDSIASYDITELEEDSTYSITVTASNSAGSSAVSNTVTAMTMEAGER